MRLIAEKYSVPLATLILSPFVLRSRHASPCMPPFWLDDWMPRYLKSWQYWVAEHCIGPSTESYNRYWAPFDAKWACRPADISCTTGASLPT